MPSLREASEAEASLTPQQRLIILQYWKDLMYSHLDSMIQAGYATFSEWEKVAAEMDILMENPEAVFYYNVMQAMPLASRSGAYAQI